MKEQRHEEYVSNGSTYELDLTRSDAVITVPSIARGSGVHPGLPGARMVPLPLDLTLLNLDRQAYVFGGPIEYAIRLVNVGSQSLLLPWSADAALVESAGAEPLTAILSLSLILPDTTRRSVGAVTLSGATNLPGTVLQLRPGEFGCPSGYERQTADRPTKRSRRGAAWEGCSGRGGSASRPPCPAI